MFASPTLCIDYFSVEILNVSIMSRFVMSYFEIEFTDQRFEEFHDDASSILLFFFRYLTFQYNSQTNKIRRRRTQTPLRLQDG